MTWLSPLLLWGLAALGAPLLLHVLRQAPRRRYAFPSLFLLQKVQKKYRRRMVLMELLLLLLRLLLVAVVVLAFAGPRLKEKLFGPTLANVLVVFYDDTASMARVRGGATLFEAARQRIRSVLAQAPVDTRVVLVSVTGQVLRAEHPKSALSATGALAVSHGPARWNKTLPVIRAALEKKGGRLLLVGDFQAATWGAQRLPALPRVKVMAAPVGEDIPVGVVLREVSTRGRAAAGSAMDLAVSLQAVGAPTGAAVRVRAELEGDGETTAAANAATGPQQVRLRLTPHTQGAFGVRVSAAAGGEAAVAYGVAGVVGTGRVLVAAPEDSPVRLVFGALLSATGEPPVVVRPQDIGGAPLEQFTGFVLAGAAPALLAQQATLMQRIEKGASVLSFPEASPGLAKTFRLLTPQGVAAETAGAGTSSFWTLRGEPAMADFTGPMAGNWPGVKVFRAMALAAGVNDRVLARFSNGKPALISHRPGVGSGHWVSVAAPLSPEDSDLAYMPAFAPMALRLLQPALTSQNHRRVFTGQAITLPGGPYTPGSVAMREVFSGETAHWQVDSAGRVYGFPPPGVWRMQEGDALVAVSLSPEEQDPRALDNAALGALAPGLEVLRHRALWQNGVVRHSDPLLLARVLTVLAVVLVVAEAAFAGSRRMTEAPGM